MDAIDAGCNAYDGAYLSWPTYLKNEMRAKMMTAFEAMDAERPFQRAIHSESAGAKAIRAAYQVGQQDFIDGHSPAENPFKRGGEQAIAWIEGFNAQEIKHG